MVIKTLSSAWLNARLFRSGLVLVLCLCFGQAVKGIGTSFLTVPSSPREMALGGSSVIVMGDPSLARGNPALIVQDLPSTQVFIGYHNWLAGIRGSSIFLAQPGLGGTLGFGIRQLMVSDLELRTEIPTDEFVSHFAASGTAVEVTWGKRRPARPMGAGGGVGSGDGHLRIGATLRWIRTDLYVYSSSGMAIDLGVVWPAIPDRLALGAAVRNVGFMGALNDKSSSLPTAVSAALSYRLPAPTTSELTLEAEASRVHGTVARVAGETGLGAMRVTLGSRFSQRMLAVGAALAVTWRRFQVSYGVEVGSHHLGIPHLFQVSTTLP